MYVLSPLQCLAGFACEETARRPSEALYNTRWLSAHYRFACVFVKCVSSRLVRLLQPILSLVRSDEGANIKVEHPHRNKENGDDRARVVAAILEFLDAKDGLGAARGEAEASAPSATPTAVVTQTPKEDESRTVSATTTDNTPSPFSPQSAYHVANRTSGDDTTIAGHDSGSQSVTGNGDGTQCARPLGEPSPGSTSL